MLYHIEGSMMMTKTEKIINYYIASLNFTIMRKLFHAITEAGVTKLFWLLIAVVCFMYGAFVDGFFPGLAARLGYAALGIFIYININVLVKYYSHYRGVIGWEPDIEEEDARSRRKY
jgi:hypothetical protein